MAKHGFSGVRLPEFVYCGFASKNSDVVLLNLMGFFFFHFQDSDNHNNNNAYCFCKNYMR